MPKVMSQETQTLFAKRLAEYVKEKEIRRAVVIIHGGEPLLAGVDTIVSFAKELRDTVGPQHELDIAMQTNGLLVTPHTLVKLGGADISVSLSLDGPRVANDLHRISRRGRSSYDGVVRAYELLKEHPKIFAGVIAVIDPSMPPEQILQYFSDIEPPKLDLLLPDAHYDRPPPGRDVEPSLYHDWLIEAFDLWFDRYPELRIRTFESLLDVAAGLPSSTDAFGWLEE